MNIRAQKQSGFVLITGLIFILIITIVTVSSMQSSNLDYSISSNEVFKDIALNGSESGRAAAAEGVSHYIYNREWAGISISGLSYAATYNPATDELGGSENLLDSETLAQDLAYDVTGANIETINSVISVVKAPRTPGRNAGLQQLAGYEGLGKGAGAGGLQLLYEIRSRGDGPSGAVAITASEFIVIP